MSDMRWQLSEDERRWESAPGPLDRQYISGISGFDRGEKFNNDEEVYQYFLKDLPELLADRGLPPLPAEALEEMADEVIGHRWHYGARR